MSKTARFKKTQSLATGSLTHDIVIGTDTPNVEGSYKVTGVRLKAASDISQVVTAVLIPAGASTQYLLKTETLSSAQNFNFEPSDIIVRRGDTIRHTCANSGTPSVSVESSIEIERVD